MEGPAQVFLLILTWLISAFGDSKRDQWKNVILAYDNMCHVDNLKVAKKELPLPGTHMYASHAFWPSFLNTTGDLKHIWMDITKIIDTLHIKNHVDETCKLRYNPESIKKENPTFNTMACEQTFAWMSRYKKIVCSMPKFIIIFISIEW